MQKYAVQIIEIRRVPVRVVVEADDPIEAHEKAKCGETVSETSDAKHYRIDERYVDPDDSTLELPREPDRNTATTDSMYLVSLSNLSTLMRTICEEVWSNTVASTDFSDILRTSLDGIGSMTDGPPRDFDPEAELNDSGSEWSLRVPRNDVAAWLVSKPPRESIHLTLRLDDIEDHDDESYERYILDVADLLDEVMRQPRSEVDIAVLKNLLKAVQELRPELSKKVYKRLKAYVAEDRKIVEPLATEPPPPARKLQVPAWMCGLALTPPEKAAEIVEQWFTELHNREEEEDGANDREADDWLRTANTFATRIPQKALVAFAQQSYHWRPWLSEREAFIDTINNCMGSHFVEQFNAHDQREAETE